MNDVLLTHNFRTHMGVLRYSSLLLEIMATSDPQFTSVKESSAVQGEKPAFVTGVAPLDLFKAMGVGMGGGNADSKRFGADQVILVRSSREKALVQAALNQLGGPA